MYDREGDNYNKVAYFNEPIDASDAMITKALQGVDEETLMVFASLKPFANGWAWRVQWVEFSERGPVVDVAWSRSFLAFAAALLANLVAAAVVTIWFVVRQPRTEEAD